MRKFVPSLVVAGLLAIPSAHYGMPGRQTPHPVAATHRPGSPPVTVRGGSLSDAAAIHGIQLKQLRADRAAEIRAAKERASRAQEREPSTSVCSPSEWRSRVTSDEAYIIAREHGATSLASVSDELVTHDYNETMTSTGHAFGMGQLTDENRERFGAKLGVDPYTVDPCAQLSMMRMYIDERYGSAANAVAFWVANHWY